MRLALLGTVAASAVLSLAATDAAQAQCAPDPATDFAVVTCSGTDLDGFSSAADGLEVTVAPGASVENDGDAIDLSGFAGLIVVNGDMIARDGGKGLDLGDGFDVEIDGFIEAENDGVEAGDGLGLTVDFPGFIVSDNRGVDAGDGALIVNDGLIDALDDAIRVGDFGFVENGGFLLSVDQEGVDAGNDLFLENSGVIDVGDEGVQAALRATIINEGLIQSFDDAIQVQGDGYVENTPTGEIVSFDNDGIDIDSGLVINAGLIRAEGAGEAGIDVDEIEAEDGVFPSDRTLLVENSGTIEGEFGIFVDPLNLESQTVINGGHISGLGGVAIDLGGGDDEVFALGGARFDGLVDGGADFDTLGFGFEIGAFLSLGMLSEGIYEMATPELGGGAIQFANFEFFLFDDASMDLATLKTLVPPAAVIPLPASAPLLIGGFALLGWVARRRRA